MKFSSSDFDQIKRTAEIINYVDTAGVNSLEQVTDEIYQHQPFLISLFLGYQVDIEAVYLDEILRILIIIWIFFRDNKNVKRRSITDKVFEAKEKKNIAFLKYLEGELSIQARDQSVSIDLGNLKSKALYTAVWSRFKDGQELKRLDKETSAVILLGMKSLIECFEDIS